MRGDSRIARIAMQRRDREGLIRFLETKTANMIQTAITVETGLVVDEMSLGSRTEIILIMHPQRGTVTAMVIDLWIEVGAGGTRTVTIEEIGQLIECSTEGATAIEGTDVGTETGNNDKSVSLSGWMSLRRTRIRPIPRKTFRSGKNKWQERTKPARRLWMMALRRLMLMPMLHSLV
jgi:hypothetical protein